LYIGVKVLKSLKIARVIFSILIQNHIVKVRDQDLRLLEKEVVFTDYRNLKIEEDDGWVI